MITFDRVTYRYPAADGGPGKSGLRSHVMQDRPALHDLSLSIEEGELVLVVGPSGAGKSTFLRCLNGLVPHFHGGVLGGRIRVAVQDPVAQGPQRMSHVVGMVFQDPETQFVTDRVEDELAFGMENRGLPRALMRKRIEEVLDQLTIAHLRERYLTTLSSGEKQRVAIATVLTSHPEVLVLDEPTSQLDPQSAEEVLVAIRRLNEDLGLTVILAEHRLERVVQFVDRVLYIPGMGGRALLDAPRAILAQMPQTPPLITLGKVRGWTPLPLTVKEARRFVREEQRQQSGLQDAPTARQTALPVRSATAELALLSATPNGQGASKKQLLLQAKGLWHRYDGGQQALRDVGLSLSPGEVVAMMGRNGSGKSTLLRLLVGLLKPQRGRVLIYPASAVPASAVLDTRQASIQEIVKAVGYVPQDPGALLFRETVLEELAFTRQGHGLEPDPATDRRLLARLGIAELADHYPRDLSAGQRQRVALASILVADPCVLLLDEPTRGLDYEQKEELTRILLEQRAQRKAAIVATHDVELAARCADRIVLLAQGEIIVDGPARDVMTGSLVFASQINKLYRDPRYVVVEDALTRQDANTRHADTWDAANRGP